MSKIRKLAGILLAVMMVMAMSAVALAEDTTPYTITINNSTDGYTYVAYHIFTGDLSTDSNGDKVLSNIEFGSALSTTDQATVLTYYSVSSAAELAEALADGTITAADFAEYIARFTLTSAGTSSYDSTNNNYTISVTGAGYYLVKNTEIPSTGTDLVYSDYILEVVANVEVSPKADTTVFDKTVGDVNDSDNSTTQGDTDSADYDIGDEVPFTLTATLPNTYGDYTTYKLVFHDTMSDGLTFSSTSVKVTIDGVEIDSSNYNLEYSTDQTTGETTITITIENIKTVAPTASAESKVVVTYTAKLNENASYKENNKAYVEYSNNPNDTNSTGTTPDDITTVFTFKLTVNKVDEDENPLKGAGFTLYKYDADTQNYVAVGNEITGADLTSFTWSGLDDGQYKLVETTTPEGYNTMDDVEFYIVAEHTEDGITSLKVTSDAAGTNEIDGYTENISDGSITVTIKNEKGSTLPSTGGIGTTIFYIVGGILVAGAAILLITRMRMRKVNE